MNSRPDSSQPPIDADQQSLLSAILRRRKAVVLGTALLVALVAAALTARQTKLYSATASVAVQSPLSSSSSNTPNMATEQQRADSLAVAQSVQRQLKLRIAATTLLSHLSVGVPVDSEVLTFTYSDRSARSAQIRANAFANTYLSLRQTQLYDQVFQSQAIASGSSLRGQIQSLAQQLAGLQANVSSSAARAALASRVNALTSSINGLASQLSALDRAAGSVSGGSVIDPAVLPTSPTQPKVVPYTLIALLLGLFLGVAAAVVLEQLDDRLRNPAEIRAGLGVPVLGVIPRVDGKAGRQA